MSTSWASAPCPPATRSMRSTFSASAWAPRRRWSSITAVASSSTRATACWRNSPARSRPCGPPSRSRRRCARPMRPPDRTTSSCCASASNLGDVVESGDDLMGDAVNVAARLESIAPHGGICVSASVYDQIVGKLTLGAEDIGRAARQEHPAAHPCLPADAGRQHADRRRHRCPAHTQSTVTSRRCRSRRRGRGCRGDRRRVADA